MESVNGVYFEGVVSDNWSSWNGNKMINLISKEVKMGKVMWYMFGVSLNIRYNLFLSKGLKFL